MTPARRVPPRRLFHHSRYELNDSPAGVRVAKRRRYRWIDLNFQVTADGYVVCTHWARPLMHDWFDPRGIVNRRAYVWDMSVGEAKRLRHTRDKRAQIVTARTILAQCARLGISVELEVKESPAFAESDEPWAYLRRVVDETGARVEVKTIYRLGNSRARIRRANAHGFTTILIRATKAEATAAGADRYRP